MQSSTRHVSALALWIISMFIFVFAQPIRPAQAFTISSIAAQRSQRTNTLIIKNLQGSASPALSATDSDGVRRDYDLQYSSGNSETASVPVTTTTIATESSATNVDMTPNGKKLLQQRKSKWIEQSTQYYSTVMRHNTRVMKGQLPKQQSLATHKKNLAIAKKMYFARHKIHSGNLKHAEVIYRKLIDELVQEAEDEEEQCDHAQLAISTLLLALLLQRNNSDHQASATREVFVRFFRIIARRTTDPNEDMECACSAKVMQAWALFEMKQGNKKKSYRLAQMAVKLDSDLEPVLKWKPFRVAKELLERERK